MTEMKKKITTDIVFDMAKIVHVSTVFKKA